MVAWESPGAAVQPLSVCFPQNSAGFIWRLYGSVIGMLPTSQSTENTLLGSHTCASARSSDRRPFWIPVCSTEGILYAALSDGLCLVCACSRTNAVLHINSYTLKDCETVKRDLVLVTEGTQAGKHGHWGRQNEFRGKKRAHLDRGCCGDGWFPAHTTCGTI